MRTQNRPLEHRVAPDFCSCWNPLRAPFLGHTQRPERPFWSWNVLSFVLDLFINALIKKLHEALLRIYGLFWSCQQLAMMYSIGVGAKRPSRECLKVHGRPFSVLTLVSLLPQGN